MKYNDLITEDAPERNIIDMVSNIALSLLSTGRTEFSTKGLVSEIKKRTGIDVPYNTIMDVLNTLPFVESATMDTIILIDGSSTDVDSTESSADAVEDMAKKAAVKSLD